MAVQAKSLGIFKVNIDRFLISTGSKIMARRQENRVEGKIDPP